MAAGCDWEGGCDLPEVPIFRVTKLDSNETDGFYCRVHGQKRVRQQARARRVAQGLIPAGEGDDADA